MMHILEIVLYSHTGEKRTLEFKSGDVNIITGMSDRGKSAISSIIDYCLNSSSCYVPAGPIRDCVDWYGVLFKLGKNRIFVARQVPSKSAKSTGKAYFEIGTNVKSPETTPNINTDIDTAALQIEKALGFGSYEHTPPNGFTRNPLKPTIRHTLGYCFQKQTEIATNEHLFHGHNDSFVLQAAKDTIPYFLGVFPENYVVLKNQLNEAKRELKIKEKLFNESEQIKGEGFSRASQLLANAVHLGILKSAKKIETYEDAQSQLNQILSWEPSFIQFPDSLELAKLQNEIANLDADLAKLDEKIEATSLFAGNLYDFEDSSHSHIVRLESANIFGELKKIEHSCPLCETALSNLPPSVQEIINEKNRISENLSELKANEPKLQQHLVTLNSERVELIKVIRNKRSVLSNLYEQSEQAQKAKNNFIQSGVLIGKTQLWLYSVKETNDNSNLRNEISQLVETIEYLEEQLSSEDWEEKLDSIQSRMIPKSTKDAQDLNLEYSENPIRLDLKRLTIFSDSDDRAIPLKEMGSAENWLGYHLIAVLNIQEQFWKKKRPVPSFLVLDQPSQVYFPRDKANKSKGKVEKDSERLAIEKIYKFIFQKVKASKGRLQVIITDHAEIDEPWFTEKVRESWWSEDEALIPTSWLKN